LAEVRKARGASRLEGLVVEADRTLPLSVKGVFEPALRQALSDRARVLGLSVRRGRSDGEVVVWISAKGRAAPLPLYFPDARTLATDDVIRIVRSVLSSMGPAAP
jgi:hypothetical protein